MLGSPKQTDAFYGFLYRGNEWNSNHAGTGLGTRSSILFSRYVYWQPIDCMLALLVDLAVHQADS